ncbi:MAG: acyl carrier protein [Lachnospiraceae bacterium]|nr:acyl carrier protein [Lachnospiraceae bacterium]
MEEKKKIISEMIAELQPYVEFDETTDLFDEDVLDSVSVLVLVQELEEEFGIEIAAEEITEYNFKNVNSIISMLQNK